MVPEADVPKRPGLKLPSGESFDTDSAIDAGRLRDAAPFSETPLRLAGGEGWGQVESKSVAVSGLTSGLGGNGEPLADDGLCPRLGGA